MTGRNAPGKWEGQRVELYALPAQDLIDFVERKLTAAGVKKVVPDQDVLQLAYERAVRAEQEMRRAIEWINLDPASPTPTDLAELVNAHLASNPADSWHEAVYRIAAGKS